MKREERSAIDGILALRTGIGDFAHECELRAATSKTIATVDAKLWASGRLAFIRRALAALSGTVRVRDLASTQFSISDRDESRAVSCLRQLLFTVALAIREYEGDLPASLVDDANKLERQIATLIEPKVSAAALSGGNENADGEYRPAASFPKGMADRLRQAASKSRKTKKVATKKIDGVVCYSVADARRWWPDDVRSA